MSRSLDARMRDVEDLLRCARAVYERRAALAPAIAAASGLSEQGVELGFASFERDATEGELRALVTAAGDADRVHVVLSANVFVAPLRAIAVARAAARHVTVRPSPRDPSLTRAILEESAAAGDDALVEVGERDVSSITAGEVHVYGRDATIAAVRARVRPGVVVRGHGAGMGVAVVSPGADLVAAADALALDVVAFDQRGCLSPRVALVLGSPGRAESFAEALHAALRATGEGTPRGTLSVDERADARRWRDASAFAGRLWDATDHAVALAPGAAPVSVAPVGRHVTVVPAATKDAAIAAMAPMARFVVSVGTDDPGA
ncbi:MAG: acyl-CoA reductase, partial [Polyangiaceae bacterium]